MPPFESEGASKLVVACLPLQMRGLLLDSPGAATGTRRAVLAAPGAAGAALSGCVGGALLLSNAREWPLPGLGALGHCIARARGPGLIARERLRPESQACHAEVFPTWLWSLWPLAP